QRTGTKQTPSSVRADGLPEGPGIVLGKDASDQFASRRGADLAEHALHVVPHGMWRQTKQFRDLCGGKTARDQARDLLLARPEIARFENDRGDLRALRGLDYNGNAAFHVWTTAHRKSVH